MLGSTKTIRQLSLALSISALLSACAVPTGSELFTSEPEKDYSEVYLRGVFNWWEASEAFKFVKMSDEKLYVDLELIADGQPYDFKVADGSWSPAYNCGLAEKTAPIELDDDVELYCFSDSLNLQFIPNETASYRFQLDVSNDRYPELTISKN
ncbi:hypothetical protein PN836_013365 [Ningiella sp. W23]|uniref:hypothetical protein n=1 Tax=Ningiella sp. W23 TaxID=3023715 RepID=UPI0037564E2C